MERTMSNSETTKIRKSTTSPVYNTVEYMTSERQHTDDDNDDNKGARGNVTSTRACTRSVAAEKDRDELPSDQGKTVSTSNVSEGSEQEKDLSLQWKIVFVIAFLYTGMFSLGFGYSLQVLYAELVRVFDTSRASVAMIQSLHMGLVHSAVILWNYPLRRFGHGRCIIVGSLIFSISIVVSAFSVNIEMFICFIGVVAGLFGSVLYLGPYLIMGKFFKKRKKFVLALLTCGASIGQIFLAYLMEKLIEAYGWSGALLIISGLAMNTVPCCILVHLKTATLTGFEENADENKLFKPLLFKDWRFVLIGTNAFICSVSILAESKFLVDLTVIKGFTLATGSLFAYLIGMTNLVGRFIGACINVNDTGRSVLHIAFFLLIAAGVHVLILLSGNYYGLCFGALLSGLSLGLSTSQVAVIMLDIFPLEHYSAALAIWNVTGGLGSVFGGYIGGTIFDLTGSYDLMFEISAVGCLFASVCFFIIYVSLVVEGKQNEYTPL